MVWVVAAAAAVLAPALVHGVYLGPVDWLTKYGVTSVPGTVVHNRQTFDQATQMIPWSSLAWSQVHQGHLPLWNPYSALGTPLAFNWQSAAFSLPALVGYALPMHLAYTVEVVGALVIAGSGTYVLSRLLGLGPLASTMAAVTFELSGSFVGWLGWPVAWVMAWSGWLFAAALLVLRGRRRGRAVALLATAIAGSVYAGQPDTLVLLGAGLLVFVAAVLVARAPRLGGRGPVRAPLADLLAGGVGGAALSAPLLLPGLQLGSHALRRAKGGVQALPAHDLIGFLVQGFDGEPLAGTHYFGGQSLFYVHGADYLGAAALVLAALGVASSIRHRRRDPERMALVVLALVAAAVAFVGVVTAVAATIFSFDPVTWFRSLLVLSFALALLAGIGMEEVVQRWHERGVRRFVLGGFAVAGALLLLVFAVGRGHLPGPEASIRLRSLLWPTVGVVAGALGVVLAARVARRRPGPAAASWLLVVETVVLVVAGAPMVSSSPAPLPTTAAEAELARAVGNSLVGFGTDSCFTSGELGIVPDANVAYEVRELADYDPLLPEAYYTAWSSATGLEGGPSTTPFVPFSLFCPAVTSSTVARRFGIGYVLEPPGTPGPDGTVLVTHVAGEGLYRVPGAADATLVARGAGPPGPDAPGRPVAVSRPDPATWRVTTESTGPAVLRLRLTDVPGWHATLDGRPLALERWADVMLQATLPAGRHVVVLHYLPESFRDGTALLGVGLLVVLWLAFVPSGALRRRRRQGSASARGSSTGSSTSP